MLRCETALHGLTVEVWPRGTYYNLSEDLVPAFRDGMGAATLGSAALVFSKQLLSCKTPRKYEGFEVSYHPLSGL